MLKNGPCAILFLIILGILILVPSRALAQVSPTNTAVIGGTVSTSDGKPVSGATISITGPRNAVTQSDSRGRFTFNALPLGIYRISATAANLGTITDDITVEGDINIAIQYPPSAGPKTIGRISVNARFNVTPASITNISPVAIALNGQNNWRQVLEQIPGVSEAGLSNTIFAGLPDSPFVNVQISIDGALPYETATLLDGMPLIGTSFAGGAGTGTNLGMYPLDGFNSADVIRGPGANSPSIVDSIGGSFVLHPPGVVTQNHYALSLSNDPYGGIVSTAFAATHFGNLSAVITYGVDDSSGPLSGNGIAPITQFAPLTIDGHTFICPPSSCTGIPLFNPSQYNVNSPGVYGFETGLLTCCWPHNTAWNQHNGSVGLTYALSSRVTAGIFYAGEVGQIPFFQPAYTTEFAPPVGYAGNISAGQYTFIEGGAIYPGSPAQQTSSLLEEKVTAGIGTGTLRFALLQNRTWTSEALDGPTSLNLQLFGGGEYCNDPPACSSTTPVAFNGGRYNVTYTPLHIDDDVQSFNRDLLLSYATPVGKYVQSGVSFVKSYYDTPSLFFAAFGNPLNFNSSSVTPPDDSQGTNELRLFVGGQPSTRTSVDLSWYFVSANYHVQNPNNPSAYTNADYAYDSPRLGFVWRPTTSIAYRAAAGGGFAEAPLGDLIGTNSTPVLDPTLGIYTTFLTNLNLQPEKSFALDFGTDMRLGNETLLSFDLYRANLYGQLYSSTERIGTYLGLPLYATQNGNLGHSRYEGILLDLHHDVAHGFDWSLSSGLTRGYVVSLPSGFYDDPTVPCTNCVNTSVVPNINFNGTFEGAIPYAQATGIVGYQWRADEYINLVATYFGNNNSYYRPAFADLDSNLEIPLTKYASILLTLRNITQVYDAPYSTISMANIIGVPAIGGAPYPLLSEEYGPRALIVTAKFHV